MLNLEQDETLTDATTALLAAEAEQIDMPKEAFEQTENGELLQSEASQGDAGKKPDESSQTDTPATAESKLKDAEATDTNKETQKPKTDAILEDKNKSKFTANTERLDKTWKAVNERKTQLDSKEQSLTQREQVIAQREQKAQLAEAKSKQKFTPEQYETAANNKTQAADQLLLQADGLDKRAENLEADGKFGEAELAKRQAQDLREQASGEKYSAKQLKQMADAARNAKPDPTIEQHKATLEQHRKHYLLEAAKSWPDVAKDGSEFQKTMAGHLQAAAQAGLDPNENPVLFYHVARLVAAESAAARVPDLMKKLGVAEAKVKELEALTAPGGGQGSVQNQGGRVAATMEEEEAALRQEAQERS